MDEHEDKGGTKGSSTLECKEAGVTLVEPMACESKIEGSLSEGVAVEGGNGEDIMVEVLGSDVFVDGVCAHGGGGGANSQDDVCRSGLVGVGSGKDMKSLESLGSQEIGVSSEDVPGVVTEPVNEGSSGDVVAAAGQNEVLVRVTQEISVVVRGEDLEGKLLEEGVDKGRKVLDDSGIEGAERGNEKEGVDVVTEWPACQ